MLLPTQLEQISSLTAVTACHEHFPKTSIGLLDSKLFLEAMDVRTSDEGHTYKEKHGLSPYSDINRI